MKIVIVEDEVKTQEGLVNIIGQFTSHTVVCCGKDGAEGIEAVKRHHPDLVISDIRMPKMDGLTMLEKLRGEGIPVAAILLTGYSDFEYARKALQLGVTEYILKPLDSGDFLDTLAKIEGQIKKNNAGRSTVKQLIYSLLTSNGDEKKHLISSLHERLPMGKNDKATLFLLHPVRLEREIITEMQCSIRKYLDSFYMDGHYVLELPFGMGILTVLLGTENNPFVIRTFRRRVLERLKEIGDFSCCCTELNQIEALERTIYQLSAMMADTFGLETGEVLTPEEQSRISYSHINYPEELESRIRKEIYKGGGDSIREIEEEFIRKIIESDGNPERIKEYTAKFSVAVLNYSRRWGEDSFDYRDRIQLFLRCTTRKELTEQFRRFINLSVSQHTEGEETDNEIILKVISFIRCNYSRDITLSEAAEQVNITPEYLSKLFAQEIGTNFVSFLRNIRISVAKQMLSSGKYKIHEVASQVGFRDVKYFNKVFKSVCGVSPSEYKRIDYET